MGQRPAHPLLRRWKFPPHANCIILCSSFVLCLFKWWGPSSTLFCWNFHGEYLRTPSITIKRNMFKQHDEPWWIEWFEIIVKPDKCQATRTQLYTIHRGVDQQAMGLRSAVPEWVHPVGISPETNYAVHPGKFVEHEPSHSPDPFQLRCQLIRSLMPSDSYTIYLIRQHHDMLHCPLAMQLNHYTKN